MINYPSKLIVAPSNDCTANCPFCYRRERGFFPLGRFKALLDELGPHLKALELSGLGEPTLHPRFPEFMLYAREKFPHLRLQLVSNGSMLWKYADFLADIGVDQMWFSLNAATPETYAKVMPGLDFVEVYSGIEHLARLCGENMRLSFLATKDNYQEATQFVTWARDMDVRRVTIQALDWGLNASVYQAQKPPLAQFLPILQGLEKMRGVECPPRWAFYPFDYSVPKMGRCGNMTSNFGIYHVSGEVCFCCYMAARIDTYSLGNVFEQSALEIWNGERATAFREGSPLACGYCLNYWSRK